MDSAEFHAAVYRVVRMIPFGKATSYGHVAKLIGMPRHSRHVGQALKFLPEGSDVPWQRVVSSTGKISSRGPGTTGAQHQRDALEEEGIEVRVTREGEFVVNWGEYGWFPERVELGDEAQEWNGFGVGAGAGMQAGTTVNTEAGDRDDTE